MTVGDRLIIDVIEAREKGKASNFLYEVIHCPVDCDYNEVKSCRECLAEYLQREL